MRALVMERDQERLKQMTYYCFTHDCLRSYILRYFGEYGASYCGNCSNCLTEFEEKDVTEETRAILECVDSCHQRYGVTVILDTLHGANTAKIRQYHMEENPAYGRLAKVSTYRLRQIFNELLIREYLHLSNDGYTIVKLGEKSRELLQGDGTVLMKLPKERDQMPKAKATGKRKAPVSGLEEKDQPLFQKLRELRSEIARREKVPPYMVFSDKTLIHMCILKPTNKEEMLQVTGVGEYKFEKYGQEFLGTLGTE